MRTIINFGEMSLPEQQAFADYQANELYRHEQDIKHIRADLAFIKKNYGIKARQIYVGGWIEVQDQRPKPESLFEKHKPVTNKEVCIFEALQKSNPIYQKLTEII
jgi:hypothetical protein